VFLIDTVEELHFHCDGVYASHRRNKQGRRRRPKLPNGDHSELQQRRYPGVTLCFADGASYYQ